MIADRSRESLGDIASIEWYFDRIAFFSQPSLCCHCVVPYILYVVHTIIVHIQAHKSTWECNMCFLSLCLITFVGTDVACMYCIPPCTTYSSYNTTQYLPPCTTYSSYSTTQYLPPGTTADIIVLTNDH